MDTTQIQCQLVANVARSIKSALNFLLNKAVVLQMADIFEYSWRSLLAFFVFFVGASLRFMCVAAAS